MLLSNFFSNLLHNINLAYNLNRINRMIILQADLKVSTFIE